MRTPKSDKAHKEKKDLPAKRKYRIGFKLNESQFEQLKRECQQAGRASMSRYIRERMGLERKSVRVNPVDLVQRLDTIGAKIGRITDSIDQVARYADGLAQRGDVDHQPIHQFNLLMSKYMAERRELVKAYRAVVRMV